MIISERLFEEISDVLGNIKLELMRKENIHLIKLKKDVEVLENVCNFINTKRALNTQIDNAIKGYNQSLVNQLIEIKRQAENNLTETEKDLL